MYPMPTPQIPPYAPGASFLSQGMFQGGGAAGHLSQLPFQQGVIGQSGGFLSKLLGGAKAGGSGVTNIMNMLQNAQKAIGTVQSVAPMIQQYAPLVKSLPALIGFMKGSGSSNNENREDENDNIEDSMENKKESSPKDTKKRSAAKASSKKNNTTNKKKQNKIAKNPPKEISKGIPAPKLYI